MTTFDRPRACENKKHLRKDNTMNELTHEIVTKVAMKHKHEAKKSMMPESDFHYFVETEWWYHMIDLHGVRLKLRFQQLLDILFSGWCDDLVDYDLDILASQRVVRILTRLIERTPELQLHRDYGDLAKMTVEPQLKLF